MAGSCIPAVRFNGDKKLTELAVLIGLKLIITRLASRNEVGSYPFCKQYGINEHTENLEWAKN